LATDCFDEKSVLAFLAGTLPGAARGAAGAGFANALEGDAPIEIGASRRKRRADGGLSQQIRQKQPE
jgi:hypothetical protein